MWYFTTNVFQKKNKQTNKNRCFCRKMFTFYPFIEHIYRFGVINEDIENTEAADCIDIETETGTVTSEALEAGNKNINDNNAATMKQSIISTITEASKNNNYDYIS